MSLPGDLANPNKFTSTYNQSFRDRKMFISPHVSQPMYHFANSYDPSHFDGFNAGKLEPPSYSPSSSSALPPIRSPSNSNLSQTKSMTPTRRSTSPGYLWPSGVNNLSMNGTSSQYDSKAATRALDDARAKYHVDVPGYHIPGYQGFVRGEQFRHGETFGRTTRRCLDVPTSIPLQP